MVVELRSSPGAGITVQIIGVDNDLPSISARVDPTANSVGWHNTDTTVSFDCSDSTSGVASCSEPVTVETEGVNQVVSGTAVDQAGNAATVSVRLSIDKTPPNLTANVSPPANGNGWHNSDVTVGFEATDNLSIDNVTVPVALTDDGVDQIVTGNAIDLAGNGTSFAVSVNLDKTVPAITNLQPAEGAQLENVRPTISADFSDNLSGVDLGTMRAT